MKDMDGAGMVDLKKPHQRQTTRWERKWREDHSDRSSRPSLDSIPGVDIPSTMMICIHPWLVSGCSPARSSAGERTRRASTKQQTSSSAGPGG